MSSGDKKVDIFLKKFLTQQQITENFFDFLEKKIRDTTFRVFGDACLFTPNPEDVDPISSDTNDTIDITTPMLGTDGPGGNILSLDPLLANNVAFENATGVDYTVGLRFVQIPRETEINVRTGKIKYTFLEEGIGERADPDVVVDDLDETLTITVDSVCEAGVSNAGRRVLVFLKDAKSQAQAFEELTVIFTGGANKIETTTAFGQILGNISTNAADYEVILLGPTIKRNTDLSLDNTILYIGKVTGDNGTTPSVFDFTGVCTIFTSASIQGILDSLFAFLVDGGNITWDLDAQELTWSSPLKLLLPHRGFDFTVAAQTVAGIADGDVLFITRDEIGGVKTITKVANGDVPNNSNSDPIAVRSGDNIYLRNGVLELEGVAGDPTVARIDGITQDLLNFIGAVNESDGTPNYLNALGSAVKNMILADDDKLTRAIKKLETRPGAIDEVRVIDLVNTSLPTGTSVVIDGVTLANENRVAFVQVGIEGVYQLSGVGVALAWNKLPVFKGSETPANGKLIVVLEGSIHLRTTWERTGAGLWRQFNTSEMSEENTGFHKRFDSAISFVDVTRTFTIAPEAPATFFDYLQKGKAHRIDGAKNIVIPDVEGLHFIFFDGETLSSTQTFTNNIIENLVFVATVNWDATNSEHIMLGDERHGLDMDGATHKYLHFTQGARYTGGLALGFDDSGDGSDNAHAQVSVGDGNILDEDIQIDIVDDPAPSDHFEQILDPIANIPVYFRDGASGAWRKDTATTFPVKQGGSRLAFNLDTAGTWTQPDATDGNFVAMWLFATNNIFEPVIAVLGQREDTTLSNAQANNGFQDLQFGTLPSLEMKVLFRLIFETQTAFGNTPKARLALGGVQDLRTAIDTTDHGNQTGLQDKDHNLAAINVPTPFSGLGTFLATDDDLQKLMSTLDAFFASLQIHAHPSNPARFIITGSDVIKTDNTTLGQAIASLMMEFTGAEIALAANGDLTVFEDDGSTALGIDNTITPLPGANEWTWIGVNLVPNLATANGKISVQILLTFGDTPDAVKDDAKRAPLAGNINIGQVAVQRNAGDTAFENIIQDNMVQFSVGGGTSGGGGGGAGAEWAGDALEFEEFNQKVWSFTSEFDQTLTVFIKVPEDILITGLVNMLAHFYSPSAADEWRFQLTTTLLKEGVDPIDDTTNQNVNATTDFVNAVAKQIRKVKLNLTDSAGKINSITVESGDLLKLELVRIAIVSGVEDSEEIRFVPGSTEMGF